MASSNATSSALPFMAVGRVKDACPLASCNLIGIDEQRKKTEDIFRKLLTAAKQKLKPGQRTRLQWNDGSVCCLMDNQGEYLYCVVNSFMEYPESCAYKLLTDFSVEVKKQPGLTEVAEGGLTATLQPKMKELMNKYENPAVMDQEVDRSLAPGAEARSLTGTDAPKGACPCCSVM